MMHSSNMRWRTWRGVRAMAAASVVILVNNGVPESKAAQYEIGPGEPPIFGPPRENANLLLGSLAGEIWPRTESQPILTSLRAGALRFGDTDADHVVDWLDPYILKNDGRILLMTVGIPNAIKPEFEPYADVRMEKREKWLSFVGALALRYRGHLKYYELGNEVSGKDSGFVGYADEFADLLASFADAIREQDTDAKIVVSLGGGDDLEDPRRVERYDALLDAFSRRAATKFDAFDIHYHKAAGQGGMIGRYVAAFRQHWATYGFGEKPFLATEVSTWTEQPTEPALLPYQTEADQAAFAVESVYTALAEGALFVLFGTAIDRPYWKDPSVVYQPSALDGLFYNPNKAYSEGGGDGPKKAAYTVRLMTWLLEGAQPSQFSYSATGDPTVIAVAAGGTRPHLVVWWEGNGTELQVSIPVTGYFGDYISLETTEMIPNQKPSWPPSDPIGPFQAGSVSIDRGEVTLTLTPHHPIVLWADKKKKR